MKHSRTSTADLAKTSCARFWATGGWRRSCSLHCGSSWRGAFGVRKCAHRVQVLAGVGIIPKDSRFSNLPQMEHPSSPTTTQITEQSWPVLPRLRFVGNNGIKHRGTTGTCRVHQRLRPLASPSAQTSPRGRLDRRDSRTGCADRRSQHLQSLAAYTWRSRALSCRRHTPLRRCNQRGAGRIARPGCTPGSVRGSCCFVAVAAPAARWCRADTSAAEWGQEVATDLVSSPAKGVARRSLALLRARAVCPALVLGKRTNVGERVGIGVWASPH